MAGIIVGAFFWFRTLLKKTPFERKSYVRKSVFYGLMLSFVLLAAMGRLNWIIAALSVVIAFISRLIPVALRYTPQIYQLWAGFRDTKDSSGEKQGVENPSSVMTPKEACKILDVSSSATRQEVIDAHRKLILKNHPDRGGSSYLAAQINLAKEILLQH